MKYRILLSLILTGVMLFSAAQSISVTAQESENVLEVAPIIWEKRFWGDNTLHTVIIREGAVTIEKSAFQFSSLKKVILPDSLTTIESEAFAYTDLESVHISKGVSYIADDAFDNCRQITEFTVDPENESYSAVDGVLYDKLKNTLIKYPAGREDTSFNIPHTVTKIADNAFKGADNLTELTLSVMLEDFGNNGSNLHSIEKFSVSPYQWGGIRVENEMLYDKTTKTVLRCPVSAEGTVTVPDGATEIARGAFLMCSEITEIILPNTVTAIGESAFEGCTGITSIDLPSGLNTIAEKAFSGCTSLKGITLPRAVKRIEELAFYDCVSLEYIVVSETPTSYDDVRGIERSIDYFSAIDEWGDYVDYPACTVYCIDESVAESFAVYESLKHISMPRSSTSGDVNGDGKVSLTDAAEVLRHIAGWETVINLYTADVSRDNTVNLTDASLLLKSVAGWDAEIK